MADVLTTMLDESIPLTTNEYDEWGNPNEPQFYDVIEAYSP
ncbi:prolyl oligopeptidase family serine peptidase [Pseudoalteromonas sp. B193]